MPIAASECPAAEVLQNMSTCDNVTLGELCEADGECSTDVRLNNCDQAREEAEAALKGAALKEAMRGPGTGGGDGRGPRMHAMRNNDVYKKVQCAANAVYVKTTIGGVTTGKWVAPPPESSDNAALVVVLVLLALGAVGAAVAAHKYRAALAAQAKRLRLWMKGEADVRPYTRNHEVASMASATTLPAPSSSIAGNGDNLTVPASTYSPPATF